MTITSGLLMVAVVLSPAPRPSGAPASLDRAPSVLDVRDFGCVGDGVTDDGPCLQAALDAAAARQVGVYFPTPDAFYRTRRELWLRHAYGIRVFGDNPWRTKIVFDLPSGSTGLWVYNCYGVTFEGLTLRGSDTEVLDAVVNVQGDSSDPLYGQRVPGSNRFTNLRVVGGEAYAEYGLRFTIARGSKDWNNDLSIWTGVDVAKARSAGVSIEHANSKSHQFHDCKFLFMGRGRPSSRPGAPNGWDSYPTDRGYGIWLKLGSFHWHGGYMGVVKGAYFHLDTLPVDGLVIRDGDFESGARILDVTPSASMPFHLVLEGNRYSAAYTNAPGAESEHDSTVVRVSSAVVASVRSNFFGEAGQTGVTKIAFPSLHPSFAEVVGNAFESVGVAQVADLITGGPGVELDVHGNTFRTSGASRVLRRPGAQARASAAAAEEPAAARLPLRGTVTFTGPSRAQEVPLANSTSSEACASYFVATGPAHGVTGSPPAGALRLRGVTKSACSAVFELEQAPGKGASVSFDWLVTQ